MINNAILIGNDHGGIELKHELIKYMDENNILYKNIGSDTKEIVRYPYYASIVASAVSEKKSDRGILICSTGIGMSIIANKYKGVRASLCTSEHMAKMTREHNDSNILCLGGKITDFSIAIKILEVWLTTEYIGGRHDISLGLIKDAEDINFSKNIWKPNFERDY